jgi:hypothetical protein
MKRIVPSINLSRESMKHHLSRATLALIGAGMLSIYGCGGGSVAVSQTPSNTITPVSFTAVSVTAATGLGFEGAIVTINDKTGATVGTSSAVGADGVITIALTSGAVAPYVLTATRTNADGATETLVSVLPSGTGTSATASVNITPITNLIAARLSPTGNPTNLAAEMASGAATVNATTVSEKVTEVQAILSPILIATGTADTNPLTGTFATNGTGYDRLLDSVNVTITPESASATNIEVGLKMKQADGALPLVSLV